ncbi:hypothetical protein METBISCDRAFT_26073 [Metschnikowia bicuspidata]|uniref:Uncharacterized protein n=1 Tax=Metschnikowia bicuspidata TaxID=27322 RepID=A0A4P9ZGB8_9ASCO|nr:hypothetical protein METBISCDRAFT_26073 [Metschnikowia bicuspidata]
MSTFADDYELALWDHSFYSSTAAITQLMSYNHIHALRKNVNIPSSELSQLIAGRLLEAPDEQQSDSALQKGPKKTLLMRVSPSIRALEKALNLDVQPTAVPEVIIEESESPETAEAVADGVASARDSSILSGCKARPAASRHSSTSQEGVFSYKSDDPVAADPEPAHDTHVDSADVTRQKGSLQRLHQPDQATGANMKDVRRTSQTSQPTPERASAANTPPQTARTSLLPLSNAHIMHQKNLQELESPFILQTTHRPVKSMVDAAVLAAPEVQPEQALLRKDESQRWSGAISSKASSVFGTPKSPAKFPAPGPKKGLLGGMTRSSTSGDVPQLAKMLAADGTDRTQNKRFSFWGLFKLKFKAHSLARIKKEKAPEPQKLPTKSPSTPNFQETTLAEAKGSKPAATDEPRGLFRRRKSQSNMDLLSNEPVKSMLKSATDSALSLRSKPLPSVHKEKPSSARVLPKLPSPPKITGSHAVSPQISESLLHMDTPGTAVLSPGSDTIREVDDSDYLMKVSETCRKGKFAGWELCTPTQHSEKTLDADLEVDLHYMSLLDDTEDSFGSPFTLAVPTIEEAEWRCQALCPPQSDLISDNERSRRSSNISNKEQLVGEALFPKTLNPHEIESIVSLERSISMRSLRSNGKRSSFLNYNGSDENVVLGSELGAHGLAIWRSGSILKNSQSLRSLRAELVSLIDAALGPVSPKKQDENAPKGRANAPGVRGSVISSHSSQESFSQLIDFADYIDFDNLAFETEPDLLGLSVAAAHGLSSPLLYVDPVAVAAVDDGALNADETQDDQNDTMDEPRAALTPHIHIEAAEEYEDVWRDVVDTLADAAADTLDHSEEASEEPATELAADEPFMVNSSTEKDFSLLPDTETDGPEKYQQYPETYEQYPESKQAPSETGVSEEQVDNSPRPVARPYSMSFKGFHGTLNKRKVLGQHGLHQLLQDCSDSDNMSSLVGQGFGSSDDEYSDDEGHTTSEIMQAKQLSPEPKREQEIAADRRRTAPSSAERRQQHLNNVLQMRPPAPNVPFHQDHIPSISDQSAASSPRLLASMNDRLRKPTPQGPARRTVLFCTRIILYDTYHPDEYDRHPDVATCNQLTPSLAQHIKDELNEFKAEMVIHTSSRDNTHFF